MRGTRSISGLLVITLGTLAAQPPATARRLPLRLELEDAFLAAEHPPERVEVNGRIVVVADLVRAAKDAGVADEELARHCLEQLVSAILKEHLERKKAWLDDDAYEAAYATYAEPYDTTPFTVEVVAKKWKGFPSLEAFQQRWRIVESFARSLPADALDDKALKAEAERSRDLLSSSGIEVELWFHEAKAGDLGRRDFATALRRAEATRAAIAAAKDGDATPGPDVVHLHLGADQPVAGHLLRQQLRESEFTTWMREGVCEALFRAAPGELLPPLRGADGVYVARVVRKVGGKARIDLKYERARALVRELLVQSLFREWIDTAFADSVVRVPQDAARTRAR